MARHRDNRGDSSHGYEDRYGRDHIGGARSRGVRILGIETIGDRSSVRRSPDWRPVLPARSSHVFEHFSKPIGGAASWAVAVDRQLTFYERVLLSTSVRSALEYRCSRLEVLDASRIHCQQPGRNHPTVQDEGGRTVGACADRGDRSCTEFQCSWSNSRTLCAAA